MTAVIALNTCVAVAVVAGMAGLIVVVKSAAHSRRDLPPGTSQALAEEEHGMNGVRYDPYVGWRRNAFAGSTIHVDERGVRRTPGAECTPGAYKLFALGGSAMWGTASPDGQTIASYLFEGLSWPPGRPKCVVNFGEQGFVSTQEALELVLQLRRGNVPDAVVFYDGFNDAFATYQSGSAGVHYDLGVIAAKFSCAPLWPCVGASPAVGTLLTMLGRRHEAWHSVDLERLAASTRDVYVQNYHLVAALGREYGFRYAFFVQPVLVEGRKPLTPEERAISLGEDSRLVRLIHATFDRLREVMPQYPQLHDLTDAFDSEKAYIYADSVHVAPAGNAIVARRMLNAMKRW